MTENLGNASATQERLGGTYRKRRDASLTIDPPASAEAEAGALPAPPAVHEPAAARPSLPSLDPAGLTEPVYPPPGWDQNDVPPISAIQIADHPLLRGLLLELPPRGTVPSAGWLDRWFEATRSILELLYLQDTNRPR